jgi:hypothetical protein
MAKSTEEKTEMLCQIIKIYMRDCVSELQCFC